MFSFTAPSKSVEIELDLDPLSLFIYELFRTLSGRCPKDFNNFVFTYTCLNIPNMGTESKLKVLGFGADTHWSKVSSVEAEDKFTKKQLQMSTVTVLLCSANDLRYLDLT